MLTPTKFHSLLGYTYTEYCVINFETWQCVNLNPKCVSVFATFDIFCISNHVWTTHRPTYGLSTAVVTNWTLNSRGKYTVWHYLSLVLARMFVIKSFSFSSRIWVQQRKNVENRWMFVKVVTACRIAIFWTHRVDNGMWEWLHLQRTSTQFNRPNWSKSSTGWVVVCVYCTLCVHCVYRMTMTLGWWRHHYMLWSLVSHWLYVANSFISITRRRFCGSWYTSRVSRERPPDNSIQSTLPSVKQRCSGKTRYFWAKCK